MKLTKLLNGLDYKNIFAINGHSQDLLLMHISNLIDDRIIIKVTENQWNNPILFVKELIRADTSSFFSINTEVDIDIITLAQRLENLPKIDKHFFLLVDLFGASDNTITQIFSSVRDLSFTSIIKNNFKISFWGNWSHPLIKTMVRGKGSSYPFVKGMNEFYLSELCFTDSDYEVIVKKYHQINEIIWENILDYTKGEILSTTFMLNNLKIGTEQINYRDLFTQKCYDYYFHYKMKDQNYEAVKNTLSNKLVVGSILSGDELNEDILYRSNLLKPITYTGERVIFSPYNYFSEYTLYQLYNDTRYDYQPTPQLSMKHKLIINEIMEIELFIKQCFRLLDSMLGNNMINNLPLFMKQNSKRIQISTGNSIFNDQLYKDKLFWQNENQPEDFISVFTLGQLYSLFQKLEQTYAVEKDFEFNFVDDAIEMDSNGILLDTINNIKLLKEDLFSLISCCNNKYVCRLIRAGVVINDLVIKKSDHDALINLEIQKKVVPLLNSTLITKNIGLFVNYFSIKDTFNDLLRYRNALAHLKVLSTDAIEKYTDIKKELFKNMSLRF